MTEKKTGSGSELIAPRNANPDQPNFSDTVMVPRYLEDHYWWAYIRPWAIRIFERQWLINLILWGNYRRLRDVALDSLGEILPGRTLQVACVYGDLTEKLSSRVKAGAGSLDVVDVLPIQLQNLRRKLADESVRLLVRNSSDLRLPDACYDRGLLFFLLHEQPLDVRKRTLAEVFRVVKPGGTVLIVDYARPSRWNLLCYVWLPLTSLLEPYAADLWHYEVSSWLPAPWAGREIRRESFFGGLYQKILVQT